MVPCLVCLPVAPFLCRHTLPCPVLVLVCEGWGGGVNLRSLILLDARVCGPQDVMNNPYLRDCYEVRMFLGNRELKKEVVMSPLSERSHARAAGSAEAGRSPEAPRLMLIFFSCPHCRGWNWECSVEGLGCLWLGWKW